MSSGYIPSNVRWLVEFYPFPSPVPTKFDSKASILPSAPASIIVSLKTDAEGERELFKSKEMSGSFNLIKGLKRISMSRSKATPSSRCSMSFVGPLPSSVYVGVWTVVSSAGNGNNLVRFIGQVESVDCSYQVDSTGLRSQQSTVIVREWSSIFDYAVRFDKISATLAAAQTTLGANVEAAALLARARASNPLATITKIIADSYDPLELAQNILGLVGAMNTPDLIVPLKVGEVDLNKIAMTMPSVPTSVMRRIGVEDQQFGPPAFLSNTPSNPYASGFINVATGTLTGPVHTEDDWDGIFERGGMESIKKDMKKGYANNDFRPLSQGVAAVLQSQKSVWGMISENCDPMVYEFYTDIWYEKGVGGKTVCKPTVVMRDKPFAMDSIAKEYTANYDSVKKFTAYDSLPRIRIDATSIMSFRINNNLRNSPNYFMINYSPHVLKEEIATTDAMINSRRRLEPEMTRFGGHDFNGETVFLGNIREQNAAIGKITSPGTPSVIEYLSILSDLMVISNAFDYLKGNGTLSIKDNNYAISIGWNVLFDIGKWTLCGHVDAVSLDFYIDDDGLEVSNMSISLSRIVVQKTGSLAVLGAGAGPLAASAAASAAALSTQSALPIAFKNVTLETVSPDVWGDLFGRNS